jgi:hypothetical protein
VAHVDPILGIAVPHQSTVDGILRAVRQGVFTAAEADVLIGRIRVHASASPIEPPVSVEDSVAAAPGGHATNAVPHGPGETVS